MITYFKKNFVVMSLVAAGTILGLGFAGTSFAQSGGIGAGTAPSVLTKDGNLNGGVNLGQFELAPKGSQSGSSGLGNSSFFGSTLPKIFRPESMIPNPYFKILYL